MAMIHARFLMRLGLGAALCLAPLGAGCGDDGEPAQTPIPEDFVLPEPASLTYDAAKTPRGVLPASPTEVSALADALSPPLALQGDDTGEEGILYAAVLGGYYLMKAQRPDGGFGYQHDLEEGTWADEDQIHRQCGSTYTQAYLAEHTGRLDFSVSTEWALRYLTTMLEPQTDGSMKLVDLGGTALLLLSVTSHAKHTGDTSRDELIEQLGRYILNRLDLDGKFRLGGSLQWAQASLALWKLYDYTQDVRYLDALENAGRYLSEHPDLTYEATDEGYLMSLWVAEPLTELYEERPLPWIPAYLFRLTDPIIEAQYTTENTDDLDALGSYICEEVDGDPTWRTALRLEGVVDAAKLARLLGDDDRYERYRQSTLWALYYLQGIQLRSDRTRGAADPALVVGAWPLSGQSDTLRADVTHHTANTLLKAALIFELERFERE